MKFICGIGPGADPRKKECGAEFDTFEALADHINGNEFNAKHRTVTNEIKKEKTDGDKNK
jgi:hypothetical protein